MGVSLPAGRALGATLAAAAAVITMSACSGKSEEAPASTTTPAATTSAAASPAQLTSSQREQAFLQTLDSYKIDYGNDADAAVGMAQSICSGLGRGLSRTDLLPALMEEGPGYTRTQAANFINTSIVAYCEDEA
ncbi:DUF732 domain-containing protein [Rhodococcus hoagii]|nr:DUF732 domain-containing protein [Prescottella equi]MBM4521284.1 DUF732 domain-containing protein [Prescottella equi]NKR52939.1 DUF732 domain-containing protein [Prescottella equi]NKR52996.1 DUF732 domain-containing protein [Prescottella equi]